MALFFKHRDLTALEQRRSYARGIERILADLDRRSPWSARVFRPRVVAACAPSLRVVVATLRDQDRVVSAEAMRQLDEFVTNGAVSSLHGFDASAAAAAASDLAAQFAPAATSQTTPRVAAHAA